MRGRPNHRWPEALATGGRSAVLTLFLLSLAFVFINNRFTPTRAAARQCTLEDESGSLALVDGFCLWVRDRGPRTQDPTVILLHSGPDFPTASYDDAFRFLEHDRRVIAYDQRGAGHSQVRELLSFYTMSQLVQELELLRRNVIRSDSIVLIGHRLGGTLALQYALTYPAYVDRVILISPLPPEGERMSSLADPFISTLTELVDFGLPPADPEDADAWHARAALQSARRMFSRADSVRHLLTAGGSFGPARALMSSLAAAGRGTTDVRGLTVPVLVLGGSLADPDWMPAYRQDLVASLPHAKQVTFPQSGDWPFFEEPERFQRTVTAFLSGKETL